jgi:hypothetical protein
MDEGRYQTLRSISDNHVFVVCREGGFYDIPQDIRRRGPWQVRHRGESIDQPPLPRKTKNAPAAINAKPANWLRLSGCFRYTAEKPANTMSVITS